MDGRLDMFHAALAKRDPTGVFANAFAQRIGVVWPAPQPSGSSTSNATPSTTRYSANQRKSCDCT